MEMLGGGAELSLTLVLVAENESRQVLLHDDVRCVSVAFHHCSTQHFL